MSPSTSEGLEDTKKLHHCTNLTRTRMAPALHDLVLRDARSCFCTFHGIAAVGVRVLDKCQAERTPAILVACKFRCTTVSAFCHARPMQHHIPMAVSAFSAVSNCTTPVPRDRPFGSYWISARSTLPMVVKSSTRSSLLVDHGNWFDQRCHHFGNQVRRCVRSEHKWSRPCPLQMKRNP